VPQFGIRAADIGRIAADEKVHGGLGDGSRTHHKAATAGRTERYPAPTISIGNLQ
jgi:hypothetical protein